MRLSPLIVALAALAALIVVGVVGAALIHPNRPLLADAKLSVGAITPNADGVNDATQISYVLNRSAKVGITFTNKGSGQQFVFRKAEERPAESYQVLFSGIVDGYSVAGDPPGGGIETRLVPNGDYTWTVQAVADDNGETATSSGTLSITDADTALPAMTDFNISPQTFTPNQDGIDDPVDINIYLT